VVAPDKNDQTGEIFMSNAIRGLQAMDQMQRRRHLYRKDLPLRASEYFLRQGYVTITDDPVLP
jgi:hypothetical protein